MRQIDADALKDNMFGYAPPEMTWDRSDIEHKIDEMPTIDAIPVEWLEQQFYDNPRSEWANKCRDVYMKWLRWLRWQKEQEAR